MAATNEPSGVQEERRGTDRWLRAAALVFLVTFVGHTADHLRRGLDAISTEVEVLGNAGTVLTVVAIGLVLAGHRWGPAAAVAAGLPLALGFALVHFLPDWGAFSDSFPSGDVDALSWLAASGEVVGALVFAAAGARALRRDGLVSLASG
ncbi:MAG: hypothetical protein ACLFXM_08295 [Acidimicrobiia bacterium]